MCREEKVGTNEAIIMIFERYSKAVVPIEVSINFGTSVRDDSEQTVSCDKECRSG